MLPKTSLTTTNLCVDLVVSFLHGNDCRGMTAQIPSILMVKKRGCAPLLLPSSSVTPALKENFGDHSVKWKQARKVANAMSLNDHKRRVKKFRGIFWRFYEVLVHITIRIKSSYHTYKMFIHGVAIFIPYTTKRA
jgi:hypothetical protein